MESSQARFLPLDVFRGLTVCFMIIVNTPGTGDVFAPLEHAKWHGFTPTDLVFPSFLFAVGNAMSFSMRKFKQMGNATVLQKILRRTLLIFLLGFIMYWLPFVRHGANGLEFIPFSDTRVFGVLQRIGLCYGIASLLILYLPKKALPYLCVALLLSYWGLAYFFGQPGDPYSLPGNADLRLDRFLLGDSHLYHGEGVAFDPEGLLSTMPAIVNVIAGYLAGLFVQQRVQKPKDLGIFLQAGCYLIVIALLWNLVFPINKKIWTSSFVLLTVGLDVLILTLLIYLIDFKKSTSWTGFFTVFGKNPLFLYLLSEVGVIFLYFFTVHGQAIYTIIANAFQAIAPGKVGSLLFAIAYMLFCWSVGKILDKKRIYVRV
jgi:predicted acyltransferase